MRGNFILSLFLLITLSSYSQYFEEFWQVGGGYNFVDDSGPGRSELFNFQEVWQAVPYPSRITAGYYLRNGLGFEVIGSYNRYKAGKFVDGEILLEDQNYTAVDSKISYSLNRLFRRSGWFDPYLMTGMGYAWIGESDKATYNAGLGFNFWVSKSIGVNLNSMAKFGLFEDPTTNHLQHSVGLVYNLGARPFSRFR